MKEIGFQHKKKFGQNFLNDKNIIRKIVDAAEVTSTDHVWEIGPGMGILTEELLSRTKTLTAFEIDADLFPILEKKFGNRINLIKRDVLKADWNTILTSNLKIVANIPYQITSPLLFKIMNFHQFFSSVTLMIQKEVGERLIAKPGTKDYGILTVKTGLYFQIKKLFIVKAHLFTPVPKVDSLVIQLTPRKDIPEISNHSYFWQLVELSFRNRRKMLKNNILPLVSSDHHEKLSELSGIDLSRRGESLTEKEFLDLYYAIEKLNR